MVAALLFLASVAIGLIVGYFAQRALKTSRTWSLLFGGLAFTIPAMGSAAFIYIFGSTSYPAYGDKRFKDATNFTVVWFPDSAPSSLSSKMPAPEAATSARKIQAVFPAAAGKGEDFQVRLIVAQKDSFARGEYRSSLQTSRALEVRPQHNCPSPSDTSNACVSSDGSSRELEFSWDVTPLADGIPTVRISLPVPNLKPPWEAFIWLNGDLVLGGNLPDSTRCLVGSSGGGDLNRCRPFAIRSESPQTKVLYAGIEMDLTNGYLRFPIHVETSLGISGETYAKLALFGTVLSGLLGSGWLWKLLDVIRARKGPGTQTP